MEVVDVIYHAFRSLFSIMAIIGNGLTVLAVVHHASMRTLTSNIFILSLTVADLLGSIFYPLSLITDLYMEKMELTSWHKLCLVKEYFILLFSCASIFSVLLISIDRCLAVSQPLKYKVLIPYQRAWIISITAWAYLFLGITLVFIFGNQTDSLGYKCSAAVIFPTTVYYALFIPHFAVVTMVTIVMYIVILIFIWQQHRKVQSFCSNQTQYAIKDKVSKSVTSSLMLIVGLYLVLYLPVVILSVLFQDDSPAWLHKVYTVSLLLFFISTWINPIVYAFKLPSYKKAFKTMLFKGEEHNVGSST